MFAIGSRLTWDDIGWECLHPKGERKVRAFALAIRNALYNYTCRATHASFGFGASGN